MTSPSAARMLSATASPMVRSCLDGLSRGDTIEDRWGRDRGSRRAGGTVEIARHLRHPENVRNDVIRESRGRLSAAPAGRHIRAQPSPPLFGPISVDFDGATVPFRQHTAAESICPMTSTGISFTSSLSFSTRRWFTSSRSTGDMPPLPFLPPPVAVVELLLERPSARSRRGIRSLVRFHGSSSPRDIVDQRDSRLQGKTSFDYARVTKRIAIHRRTACSVVPGGSLTSGSARRPRRARAVRTAARGRNRLGRRNRTRVDAGWRRRRRPRSGRRSAPAPRARAAPPSAVASPPR